MLRRVVDQIVETGVVKERNQVLDSKDSKHLGFFRNDPRDTRSKFYVSCLHCGGGQENTSSAALVKWRARREAEGIFFSPLFLLLAVWETHYFFPLLYMMWTIIGPS